MPLYQQMNSSCSVHGLLVDGQVADARRHDGCGLPQQMGQVVAAKHQVIVGHSPAM